MADPAARVKLSAPQSYPAGPAVAAVPFGDLDYSSPGVWSPSDPTKFFATKSGRYLVCANLFMGGDEIKSLFIGVNGVYTGYPGLCQRTGTVDTSEISTVLELNAGDYIEILANGSAGGPIPFDPPNGRVGCASLTFLNRIP